MYTTKRAFGRTPSPAGGVGTMRLLRVGMIALLLAATMFALIPGEPASAQRTVAFGAHPGGVDDGRTGAMTGLEDQLDRQLDFVRVFELWNSPFPTAFHDTVVDSDRTMLLSVRAKNLNGTYVSWRSIADAQPGSAIHTQMVAWIERVRDIGEPVWFTFNHEPEVVENIANGVDDDFIDAWRRVITEFRDRGVTNVEFVWIMTDYSFEVPSSDRRHAAHWYPGDEYVDHIAADAYNWSSCRSGQEIPWEGLASIITPLRDFGAQHPDKGLMLAEWASTIQGGDKAAWIAAAADLFKQPGWEQFIAVSYFHRIDNNYPNCNWPVTSSQSAVDALAAMGADPFYNGDGEAPPPPPPPPPPVNTVMTGTVDSTNVIGPRWLSRAFTPTTTGAHTFTLTWPGSANLRFEVRQTTGNVWVAANTSTAQPKTATANLTAGVAYSVSVWSMSGVGAYSMTIAPPGGNPNTPPAVSVSAPVGGSMVSGSVDLKADATDDVGVTSVAFVVDDATIGTDTNAADGWSVPWDTTTVGDGSHTVSAKATDTAGTATTSSALTVTVQNETPPETPIFTAKVNAANTPDPRWVSATFTPASSGAHTITLDWTGSANLRFDLRLASTNAWMATNSTTAQPKSVTATLTAGVTYRIAVWSMSGAATFTVSSIP